MTTKTDTHAVSELKSKYNPAVRGVLSKSETDLISNVLELKTRTNIELQNIRDVTVILYGQWTDSEQQAGNVTQAMALMDAMSGATAAIDLEKTRRGLPV